MRFEFGLHQRRTHLIFITAIGLLLALPAVIFGFPAHSHDGWIHALWLTHFSEQLWGGDPYPRWLSDLNGGLGSPAFFFYPPLPYYLSSVFKPFFESDGQEWFWLGLSASLALIASGWSAYLWLNRITGRNAAWIAATLYMATPYHTIVDLYIRGALAELFAFVWMPLIFYFAHRLKSGERGAVVGMAASYMLLVASHLPTAMIIPPFAIGYALFTAKPEERVKKAILALAAMTLGLGLSAIYLLPAVTMRDFVSMQELTRPEFRFDQWFLFASLWPERLHVHLDWIAASVLIAAVCAFFISSSDREEAVRRERTFWIIAALIAVFVMTPLSAPIWRALPLLQTIQFPFRFNTILALATAALLALGFRGKGSASDLSLSKWLAAGDSGRSRYRHGILALVALLWLIVTPALSWRAYQTHHQFNAPYNQAVGFGQDAPEYRPRWVDRDRFVAQADKTSGDTDRVFVSEGNATAKIETWRPGKIDLAVRSEAGATLDVRQYFFPGWQARITATGDEPDDSPGVQPAPVSGLLRITAPAGDHRIELRRVPTLAERTGMIISAISLAMAGLLIVHSRGQRTRIRTAAKRL